MGNTRNPSALSLEEHNFVEVGTFQPSFGVAPRALQCGGLFVPAEVKPEFHL
jgi:hypothetical protein